MNKIERELLKKQINDATQANQTLSTAAECLRHVPALISQIDALEDAARCRYEFEGSCYKGSSDGEGCCSCGV